ncbi:hypothetical protein [Streptomyces sp. ACT015]|uniref:hypothetical protein n=1 Tax=Streptomyces sp. ACT015 TaxID=3134807 RepID=UPI003D175CE9
MRIEDPADGGASPYADLAPVGVTPWTTHAAMQDVSFALQERSLMNARTQQAWNDLRSVRRRLLFDLYVYDLGDGPGGGSPAGPPPEPGGTPPAGPVPGAAPVPRTAPVATDAAPDSTAPDSTGPDSGGPDSGGPSSTGPGAAPGTGRTAPGAVGPPPSWAVRLLDDLIRFDR